MNMNGGSDIVNELEEMGSILATMPRLMPFSVPDNYFSSLDISVQIIMNEADPLLNLPKAMPYFVPSNYFNDFSATILDKVAAPSFSQQPAPFAVPEGYFNGFADKMLAMAKAADSTPGMEAPATQKKTTVLAFRPMKAIQWAAAAIFIAAIGFGSYKVLNPPAAKPSTAMQLAQLDKSLVKSYVNQNIDDFDAEMLEGNIVLQPETTNTIPALDKNDIIQYLNEEDGLGTSETKLN